MPCTRPLKGYKSKSLNPSGKRSLVFNPSQGFRDLPLEVPCGQCMHCRLEKSRQWAIRCLHETTLHKQSSFLTLTYNDENLPNHGTLVKSHFQDFIKRYRFWLGSKKIKYFMCGEYGDKFGRPHYHAIIFGHEFSDKKPHSKNHHTGDIYYKSSKLHNLWTMGHCLIGNATFESAAYVARYVTKKKFGKQAEDHYGILINENTGEITPRRIQEYCESSNGLAQRWYEQWKQEVYRSDSVLLRGKEMKPPKYYNRLFEKSHPEAYKKLTRQRTAAAKKSAIHNTWERRLASEKILGQQTESLKRNLK